VMVGTFTECRAPVASCIWCDADSLLSDLRHIDVRRSLLSYTPAQCPIITGSMVGQTMSYHYRKILDNLYPHSNVVGSVGECMIIGQNG
jgi:hypothetical protein